MSQTDNTSDSDQYVVPQSSVPGPAPVHDAANRSLAARRGRLRRSRTDERVPSSERMSLLNPRAGDFVPSASTPSKRKASSSAKSSISSEPGAASSRLRNTFPTIKLRDIVQNVCTEGDGPSMDYSSDEVDIIAWAQEAGYPDQDTDWLNDGFSLRRPRQKNTTQAKASRAKPNVFVLCQGSLADGNRLRYLTLCAANESGSGSNLTIVPEHIARIENAPVSYHSQDEVSWPANTLPVELFELITSHLSRNDVKTLRLINKEFEHKVSPSFFHTSVVPFNTELYDMIEEDSKVIKQDFTLRKDKGKRKLDDAADIHGDHDPAGLHWQNPSKEVEEGTVYKGHGLRVFQGFGPHIKRFGMSFEVVEAQLTQPLPKKELDLIESYHGSYEWPPPQYARFDNLEGLERTADETSRMKAALQNLDIVQELGLSVDSGLGWLTGPDVSLRSRVFAQPSGVFRHEAPLCRLRQAHNFWSSLTQAQQRSLPGSTLKEMTLVGRYAASSIDDIPGLAHSVYADTSRWPEITTDKLSSHGQHHDSTDIQILVLEPANLEEVTTSTCLLVPSELKKEQREWLMETEWAQRAFLESYTLAITDNPTIFNSVTTLKVTKLSSRFLPQLRRESFWAALPALENVTLIVSPDWRTVYKDEAGVVQVPAEKPSEAVQSFYRLLKEQLMHLESIKRLTIGWYGGGEHAPGVFARNKNLLPAPISTLDHCTASFSPIILWMHHIEHLTLTNCWISPLVLHDLVASHAQDPLKKLTLDSVSLTAHPGTSNHNAQPIFAQALQANMLGNNQAFANQNPPTFANQLATAHQANPYLLNTVTAPPQAPVGNGHGQAPAQGHAQAMIQAHAQAMMLTQAPNVVQSANHVAQNNGVHWTQYHREGSWPDLLNKLSPGPRFADYLPAPAPWEPQPEPRASSNLQTLELNSCGYVRLTNNTLLSQSAIDQDATTNLSPWFRLRHVQLQGAMLRTNDQYVGQIAQFIPVRELAALQLAWGLREGWTDRAMAEGPEHDGCLPGGTGRVSGIIEKGMPLIGNPPSVTHS